MTYIIVRESKGEERERYKRGVPTSLRKTVDGAARCAEEAYEMNRKSERETGEQHMILVGDEAGERRKAFESDMQKIGQDPEKVDRQWHGKREK